MQPSCKFGAGQGQEGGLCTSAGALEQRWASQHSQRPRLRNSHPSKRTASRPPCTRRGRRPLAATPGCRCSSRAPRQCWSVIQHMIKSSKPHQDGMLVARLQRAQQWQEDPGCSQHRQACRSQHPGHPLAVTLCQQLPCEGAQSERRSADATRSCANGRRLAAAPLFCIARSLTRFQ